MEKIEQARNTINKFRDLINSDEAKEIRKETDLNQVNIDIATLKNYENKELNDVMIAKIDEIIERYDDAIIKLKEILKNNGKVEDDYDLKEDNKDEDETVVEVVKTEEGKKQGKKGRGVVGVVTGVVLTAAIFFGISRIVSCQEAKNDNNETKDNSNNQTATESTQTPEVTTNDVVIPTDTTTTTTENKEPEVIEPNIDELIAEEVEKFDGGESTISKEQYEFLLNYANNNLKEPISTDVVIENVINPIMETEFNDTLVALSTANDTYDVGYDVGNYKTSNLILDNSISKQKLQDLDVLKEALKSEDPEIKEKAAEVVFYILYVINNEVNNSKDTIMINDKEYNGHEINGVKFDKDYQPEFYELNDSADQVVYLTYLNVLSHTAHFTLGEKSWIGAQEYLMGDDGELMPVQAKETFDSILDDMYEVECDRDGEYNEGYENIYSSVLNASVKENLETLKDKGYVIEESNDEGTTLTLTTNN